MTTSYLELRISNFLLSIPLSDIWFIFCRLQGHLECLFLWFWWHIRLCNFFLPWADILYMPFFVILKTHPLNVSSFINIVTNHSTLVVSHFFFALSKMLLSASFTSVCMVVTPKLIVVGVRLWRSTFLLDFQNPSFFLFFPISSWSAVLPLTMFSIDLATQMVVSSCYLYHWTKINW